MDILRPRGGPGPGVAARHRRAGAVALLLVLALAVTAGCAAVGTAAGSPGDEARAGSGAGSTTGGPGSGSDPAAGSTSEVKGVTLAADKERYRPGEGITLTVRNDTAAEIQLTGGLGGLKAWRLVGGSRQPWEHGMVETGALVPVAAGQAVQLGPIPAPDEPGRYVLEVHFYHPGGGPAAASVTVQVE
ncbi:hypothetical protein Tmar_0907 [Thermaerobacter marianensis DSM 12885]|uniref:Intracellular proteinase inhibitor BsuPI domain-containing protein n=1 Tax=Thermaerobacter marianensis (strain ATCC 700841 / DSM 12885 / JCM 10246 / 7p75a) TaxID=644966 RepID=E6SJ93_THEM7|nr:hypothetical protein [Thermaerobacter marianensis]ADU51021.1 hypothetical protein Tmar_0907 [Thermaerobacter marianensis DSM 12885]